MKKGTWAALALLAFPYFAFAQQTIADYIIVFGDVINRYIIPFLLALALLFFIWNATKFFILGGSSSEGQEKAKSLALWGILALVLIVIMWGLVNMLVTGLNINRPAHICPDYVTNC